MECINKEHPDYLKLKKQSGLSEDKLERDCIGFFNKHNRFPRLDELLNANSEDYLRDNLLINLHNAVKIDEVLKKTKTSSISDAVRTINDLHRDLETEIIPIVNEAIVDIRRRPTINNFDVKEVVVDSKPDNCMVFNNALVKLASLYGIDFKIFDDSELDNFPVDILSKKAFVYNGDIYINIDRASVDSPLHEMMHIFFGSTRFSDPKLYLGLLKIIELIPEYDKLASQYLNRTRNDISEEILIEEVSKYIMGRKSIISELDPELLYEIGYNIKRVMDSVLMGLDSVKTLTNDVLYDLSFKQLTLLVNSSIMTNNFRGFINMENSSLHRKLNNIKSDLIKNRLLEEVCD